MKKYEHDLKKLISLSGGGCEPVHQEASGLSESELRFLSAKGFIKLHPAGDNQFWVVIAPPGLAHFSNKSEAREGFIKEHIASFLTGFFSGVLVTVIAAWIVQVLL